tara:strand:+ start:6063 stop:6458 length:396 start_codon:yes stop_codon:yes gene_type:complete
MLAEGLLILSTFIGGEANVIKIDLSQEYQNHRLVVEENKYCNLDTIKNRLTADCKLNRINVNFDYILDQKNIFVEMTEISTKRTNDDKKVFVNYTNTKSLSSVFFLDNYQTQELSFNENQFSFSLKKNKKS